MYFRYLSRELRRRARSASVVAIGLALGVGLVIAVNAAASGVSAAQGEVLHSLYGVGTDLTVTKVPTPGSGGPFRFGSGTGGFSRSEQGQPINVSRLTSSGGLATLSAKSVTAISKLKGVLASTGALSLSSISVSGTFPGSSASSSSNPLSVNTFTVTGVDADDPGLGPLNASNIAHGQSAVQSWFDSVQKGSSSDHLLALVSSSYAKQQSLKAGSTVTVHGTAFKVLGLVTLNQSASSSDVYLPLSEAQSLSGDKADVNTVYVTADSSSDISTVQGEIQHLMPKATVTTAADLASQVTGSLSTASSLANSLGLWLAIAILIAAFVLAALLTSASVTRRVREFGTLKAIGWRTRRIVAQVLGESLVLGLVGGALGIGLGVLGAFLVGKLALPVQATVSPTGLGSGAPGGFGGRFPGGGSGAGAGTGAGRFGGSGTAGRSFAHTFAANSHTVTLHLTAPLSLEVLGLAVALAIGGGLLAGLFGGWRAARLQPAEALRRVE